MRKDRKVKTGDYEGPDRRMLNSVPETAIKWILSSLFALLVLMSGWGVNTIKEDIEEANRRIDRVQTKVDHISGIPESLRSIDGRLKRIEKYIDDQYKKGRGL